MNSLSDQVKEWLDNEPDIYRTGFSYLACPIATTDQAKLFFRIDVNIKMVHVGKQAGCTFYSPLLHWKMVSDQCGKSWEEWRKVSLDMLHASSRMIVLCCPGWSASKGVTAELEQARIRSIPVGYFMPKDPAFVSV